MNYKNFLFCVFMSFSLFANAFQRQSSLALFYTADPEIMGVYVLESCEDSRFKIKIEKKAGEYLFLIYDRNKVISKGKVKKQKDDEILYLSFGKIGGMYDTDKIQIQNYGNSMNEFVHFVQCDEKYLTFIKSK
ncbi:hypothetical protein [Flavobacterium sp. LHD-85]|uniref:hypothetical protein n=1 Tax=Flavobacterium sp. LHD-85 TaxID=3071410 RepID=UPI0027DFBC3C|nr:hypothetical protein [Flavobacterium sp. LHD-85]MDQ6531050.1 hypothetical protein [Flavobacterium sp. LHD-85]